MVWRNAHRTLILLPEMDALLNRRSVSFGRGLEITREPGGPKSRKSLASGEFIDPRDLGPNSPIRDLARAYLQELRDKGHSELTLPRYERFLSEFLDFVERDGAPPRVRDIDIRTLRAFSSHLARRRLLAGRDAV